MLVDGGYIKPNDFLDFGSAEKVNKAIETLEEFKKLLEDNELTYEI